MNPSNASNGPSYSGEPTTPAPGIGEGNGPASRISEVGRKAKEIAKDTAAQFKDRASSVAAEAKERVASVATDQKAGIAEKLGRASDSVHETAKKLEQEDPNIAWITHEAANRIQKVADYVRESDFGKIQDDAEDFVRRYPIVCLGGLFVAGLVVGNLLKATANSAKGSPRTTERTRHNRPPAGFPTEERFAAPSEGGDQGGASLSGPPPAETMS